MPPLDVDANSDGILDEIDANSLSHEVIVRLGRGDGTFADPIYTQVSAVGPLAGADFNGDGRIDVVTAGEGPSEDIPTRVTVLLGRGDGHFYGLEESFPGTVYAWEIGTGDIDGDGSVDVALRGIGLDGAHVVARGLNDGNWDAFPPPPPPAPPPSITINDRTVTEGNTGTVNATFMLTLSSATNVDVTVHYDTANMTALSGSDFVGASGDVVIPAGQTSATFAVAVMGDRLPEPTETFAVNLSAAMNATIGDGQGVATILDNEPRISISDATKREGRNGKTTLLTFTVTLSAAYDQPVTMSFQTVNGTATTSDNDYVARTGTLTFAFGETTKTITIEVKGDSKREANEYFYLDLTDNSSNSWFSKNRGIGTILNDD